MPPKKKSKNVVEEKPQATEATKKVEKPSAPKPEEKKEEDKKQPVPSTEPAQPPKTQPSAPVEIKEKKQKEPEAQPGKSTQEAKAESKPQTVNFDVADKLSEKEKMELRKLRFGAGETGHTVEEAQKIKQERMKKFGTNNPSEDPSVLQKRKEKFGGPILGGAEDEETIKKRKEKFGGEGGAMVAEDPDKLQERKKKFGNSEGDIVLDDEIKKSKTIKKEHRQFNPRNRKHGGGKFHNPRRFNR